MPKHKPPKPHMHICSSEYGQTDNIHHIDKESDVKSPIHIVDRKYITEWPGSTQNGVKIHSKKLSPMKTGKRENETGSGSQHLRVKKLVLS